MPGPGLPCQLRRVDVEYMGWLLARMRRWAGGAHSHCDARCHTRRRGLPSADRHTALQPACLPRLPCRWQRQARLQRVRLAGVAGLRQRVPCRHTDTLPHDSSWRCMRRQACPSEGEMYESQACSAQPCDLHCEVSAFSAWSGCTSTCGGGTSTRSRSVTTASAFGGMSCPTLSESIACATQPCLVVCAVSAW